MYLVEVTSPDEDAFVPSSEVTEETAVTFVSLSSGTVYSFSVTAIGEERQRSEPGQAVSQTVCKCAVETVYFYLAAVLYSICSYLESNVANWDGLVF